MKICCVWLIFERQKKWWGKTTIQSINDFLISECKKNRIRLVPSYLYRHEWRWMVWDKHRHLKIFISKHRSFKLRKKKNAKEWDPITSRKREKNPFAWGYQMCCSFSFPIGDEFFWSGKNYSSWKGPSRERERAQWPPFFYTQYRSSNAYMCVCSHAIERVRERERDENPIYFSLVEAIYFHSFNFFLPRNFLPFFAYTIWCDIEKEFFNSRYSLSLNRKRWKFFLAEKKRVRKMNEGCEMLIDRKSTYNQIANVQKYIFVSPFTYWPSPLSLWSWLILDFSLK